MGQCGILGSFCVHSDSQKRWDRAGLGLDYKHSRRYKDIMG